MGQDVQAKFIISELQLSFFILSEDGRSKRDTISREPYVAKQSSRFLTGVAY